MILSRLINMISQNCSCQLSKLQLLAIVIKILVYVGIGLSYFRKIKKYPKTIAASYGTYSWQLLIGCPDQMISKMQLNIFDVSSIVLTFQVLKTENVCFFTRSEASRFWAGGFFFQSTCEGQAGAGHEGRWEARRRRYVRYGNDRPRTIILVIHMVSAA